MGDCASCKAPVERPGNNLSTPRGLHVKSQHSPLQIDEDWLQQWVAFGMLELAVYLTKQAQFAAFLSKRDRPGKRAVARRKN
jgi:hypothetical protein